MTSSELALTPALIDTLTPWLIQAYPEEGCALVLEHEDGHIELQLCENLANKYHAVDPETYPRTAATFYLIDPMAFRRAERANKRVIMVIHSHVDVGDYFSEEDIAGALMPRDSPDDPIEPVYHDVDYLVVSVRDRIADHATLFRFSDSSTQFEPVFTLEPDESGALRPHSSGVP